MKSLHDHDLLDPIRRRIGAGVPYIGSSAGSIVACPSLKTTKDMPVVQPPSFEALGLVSFQISPHYVDPDPTSTHMGETQEERILQFLEENEAAVVGLREGSILRVQNGKVTLKGPNTARIFRRGEAPLEVAPGSIWRLLLDEALSCGRSARMNSPEILLLTPQDTRNLLTLDECIAAVEHAFRLHGEGRAMPRRRLEHACAAGGFHIKAGMLHLVRQYFAAKVNANFPENGARFGLPTIQGVIVLCDAEKGCPLAVMDSREITSLRTAAATAVATKYLRVRIRMCSPFAVAASRAASG